MTDIRTVEEVVVDGDYRVRIAEDNGGEDYEAAVVGTKTSAIGRAVGEALTGSSSEWSDVDDAPVVQSTGRYVAVGHAVESYLAQFEEADDDD